MKKEVFRDGSDYTDLTSRRIKNKQCVICAEPSREIYNMIFSGRYNKSTFCSYKHGCKYKLKDNKIVRFILLLISFLLIPIMLKRSEPADLIALIIFLLFAFFIISMNIFIGNRAMRDEKRLFI